MSATPTPRTLAVLVACLLVLPVAGCTGAERKASPASTPAASTSSDGAREASEERPVRVEPGARQVVRVAGDQSQSLELLFEEGDLEAATSVRAVPVRAAVPAPAPYSSFSGPLSLEITPAPAEAVVLRARAASPDAVPVIWGAEGDQWYPRAVGAPGDFAATRPASGDVVDAGGYLPGSWIGSLKDRVNALAKRKVQPPVCASAVPGWATLSPAPPTLPACIGERTADDGSRTLQVRLVNARAVSAQVDLPDGAREVSVEGLSTPAREAAGTYLGSKDKAVLLAPGAQLTFEVPLPEKSREVKVSAVPNAKTLLVDLGTLMIDSVGDLPDPEARAVGLALAQRCLAISPDATKSMPSDTAGVAATADSLSTCISRATGGPQSLKAAGEAVTAARTGRPVAEVTKGTTYQAALRRDAGLVELISALTGRAGSLKDASGALAQQITATAAPKVSATLDPSRTLCRPNESSCSVVASDIDVDGDGKKDSVALVTSGEPAQGTVYEVRVRTAAGKEGARAFRAAPGVGPGTYAGASAIDGEKGQEVAVALPTPDAGMYYAVMAWRGGGLQDLPLPEENGTAVGIQTRNDATSVVAWRAGRSGDKPVLQREVWQRRDGDTWEAAEVTWAWNGSGWQEQGQPRALTVSGETAVRARYGFFATGIKSR